ATPVSLVPRAALDSLAFRARFVIVHADTDVLHTLNTRHLPCRHEPSLAITILFSARAISALSYCRNLLKVTSSLGPWYPMDTILGEPLLALLFHFEANYLKSFLSSGMILLLCVP